VKSDFETNVDFENRIKNQSEEKFKTILAEKINNAKKRALSVEYAKLGQYDPDNEMFPIYFGKNDTAFIKVPKSVASDFYNTFSKPKLGQNRPPVFVVPLDLSIINNQWGISHAVILFDGFWASTSGLIAIRGFKFINEKGKYSYEVDNYGVKKYNLIDITTIQNPTDIKGEVYFYDWKINLTNTQSLDFTFQDLNITLPK
jgi:hypothetical protein